MMHFSRALLAVLLATSLAWAQRGAERTYDLLDVDWTVRLDIPENRIFGEVVNTITLTKPVTEVRFDSERLEIRRAFVDGRSTKFRLTAGAVWVQVPAGSTGKTVKIKIQYSGRPEAGVYFVSAPRAFPGKTPMVYTQGEMEDTRHWLPTYDFPDDKATSRATISVPSGWNVLSNDRKISATTEGGRTTFRWVCDFPHSTYLTSFIAGPYTEVVDGKRALPVSYFVPPGLEDQGAASFANTDQMIQIYENLLGTPYPYAKFSQGVVGDFMFGGMENITAVTQTIATLHPARVEPLENSEGLVAHELAHQWFGDLVTSPDWSHIWINEGFATFLPHFVTRGRRGEDAFAIQRLDTMKGAYDASAGAKRPMVRNDFELPIDNFDGFAYGGGAARLLMLMHEVGERNFWKGIKAYLAAFRGKNATTEDFFRSMSASTGRDLDGFRQQWFYRPGAPAYKVSRNDDGYVIQPKEAGWRTKVEIELVDLQSDRSERREMTLGDETVLVKATPGQAILLDPDAWLLANFEESFDRPKSELLALLKRSRSAPARMRLVRAAENAMPAEEWPPLADQERTPQIRDVMASRAKDATWLIGQIKTRSRERPGRTEIQALQKLGPTETSIAALREVDANEPNDLVRLAARQALIEWTRDEELVETAWQTESFDDRFRMAALDWWEKNQPDIAREKALEAVEKPITESLRRHAIPILGRLKDTGGQDLVRRALERVAAENSIGARQDAMRALTVYGDPRSIRVIRKAENHGLHYVRRTAAESIRKLGG